MVITAQADTIESLAFEAAPPRTPGLHLSQIIQSLCRKLDPKRYAAGQDLPWNRFECGFTFERVLEMAFASRRAGIFRPGEIELDGIIMSPDGIDPDGWVLEEYKLTWMSSTDAPEAAKFWKWIVQMQAYCYALGTCRARLRVLFLNGDYKTCAPDYRVWEFQFTDAELHSTWKMLLSEARAEGWL